MSRVKNALVRYFCPDRFVHSILEIKLEDLAARGINTLFFDLDNTLISWREKTISDEVVAWIRKAETAQYKMHIISNSLPKRVNRISEFLGIPAFSSGIKPRKKVFLDALNRLKSAAHETAVIGDQLFTDVFGGKRLGLFTILVSPVDKREFFTTTLVRIPERMLLRFFQRQGLLTIDLQKG